MDQNTTLPKGHTLFTSESVAAGHPDKIADQISDAVLDACLSEDPFARVACETLITANLIVLSGEITTSAHVNYNEIARETVRTIGYTNKSLGFDSKACEVCVAFNQQSPDIARGIDAHADNLGAGDQGIVFGYACDETAEMMPFPIMFAHKTMKELFRLRMEREIPYLGPDAKTQVTVEYDADHRPVRLHTLVLSTQHLESVSQDQVADDMKKVLRGLDKEGLIDHQTIFYINPTGRFVVGGPECDCGLTGRKIIVDTYGGMARHGGGAFSGKDPSKIDRSASYGARYIAKNIVAAKLARRCEVQICYAIGIPHPLAISVDTFGTGVVDDDILSEMISPIFDLTPLGLIKMLNLRRPIYRQTAFGGHFGRTEPDFTWEKTDKADIIKRQRP